jgi:hypothetical protein
MVGGYGALERIVLDYQKRRPAQIRFFGFRPVHISPQIGMEPNRPQTVPAWIPIDKWQGSFHLPFIT